MERNDGTAPAPEPTASELRAALDAVVRDGLHPVAGGLAVLYGLYAVSHLLVLPAPLGPAMAGVAAASAAGLAGLAGVLARHPAPARAAHPLGAAIAAVVLLNCLLHLGLADEPRQTTNLALLVIGAGCFFLSVPWLAAVVGVSLAGWSAVALVSHASGWLHFGFLLLGATVLAALVHAFRLRTVGHLERLHLRDVRRQAELEVAVDAVRQLNAELERRVAARTADLEAANRRQDELLRRAEAARAEAELARAEAEAATRAKDEFMAVLSHELRTPLTPILACAAALRDHPAGDETLREGLESIERNARVEARLIDDLLDMGRITAGTLRLERALVDLRDVVGAALDTVREAAERRGVGVTVAPAPDAVPVCGDALRLQQVVWNLVANAVKFSTPGDAVAVVVRAEGGDGVVAVEDRGQGIAADVLPVVFDRFRQGESPRTRAYGGLGIGLALVKHLVELHGGRVQAESDGPGRGARFTVRLPLARDAAGTAARALPAPRARPSLHVLVVDDSPDTLDALALLLRGEGHHVTTAPSAAAALAALETVRPDVLVSDVAMPGMDGYALLARVRERPDLAALPAVALTGFASPEETQVALDAGFDGFLAKPILEPQRLYALLAEVTAPRARV